jgi:hypothetical protein
MGNMLVPDVKGAVGPGSSLQKERTSFDNGLSCTLPLN